MVAVRRQAVKNKFSSRQRKTYTFGHLGKKKEAFSKGSRSCPAQVNHYMKSIRNMIQHGTCIQMSGKWFECSNISMKALHVFSIYWFCLRWVRQLNHFPSQFQRVIIILIESKGNFERQEFLDVFIDEFFL